MENLIKILTDPISNRIIQQIRKNQKMTVSEILAVTSDIPTARIFLLVSRAYQIGIIDNSFANILRF